MCPDSAAVFSEIFSESEIINRFTINLDDIFVEITDLPIQYSDNECICFIGFPKKSFKNPILVGSYIGIVQKHFKNASIWTSGSNIENYITVEIFLGDKVPTKNINREPMIATDLADVRYSLGELDIIKHSRISLPIDCVPELTSAVGKLTGEHNADEPYGFISFDFPTTIPSTEQVKAYGDVMAGFGLGSYVFLVTNSIAKEITVDLYTRHS